MTRGVVAQGEWVWEGGKTGAKTRQIIGGPGPALARPWPDPRGPGSSWPGATGQLAWPDPRGPGPRASKNRLALARTGPWTVYDHVAEDSADGEKAFVGVLALGCCVGTVLDEEPGHIHMTL